jgi:hypothetical protein
MSDERTLVREATVISMEPGTVDQVADILLEGEKIAAVGPNLIVAEGSAHIVDASDCDESPWSGQSWHVVHASAAHTHQILCILRNIGPLVC